MALILWSGGCDSTLILRNLLENNPDAKHGVRTLSVVHPQVMASKQSAAARKVLAAKFEARGFHFEQHTLTWQPSSKNGVQSAGGLDQPPIWLLSAAGYLHENEDLYVGWIKGDCAWQRAADCRAAFAALQSMAEKTGKLLTPLDWMRKADVLCELRSLKLLDDCWWCEDPVDVKPCRECGSCEMHETGLWQLEWREKADERRRLLPEALAVSVDDKKEAPES